MTLVTFRHVSSCTKSLSDQLQSRHLDLAKAADLVQATMTTVKEFRTDSQWNSIYKYAVDVENLHSIRVEHSRPSRRKELLKRLQGGIVLESTGVRDVMVPSLSEQKGHSLSSSTGYNVIRARTKIFQQKSYAHVSY